MSAKSSKELVHGKMLASAVAIATGLPGVRHVSMDGGVDSAVVINIEFYPTEDILAAIGHELHKSMIQNKSDL